jgi:hypothetical protein
MVINPITKSPHFSVKAHTFRNVKSNQKANKPCNHWCFVVPTKVSQAFNQVQATTKAQDPQDSSQLASHIINNLLHQVQVKISSARFVVTYFVVIQHGGRSTGAI